MTHHCCLGDCIVTDTEIKWTLQLYNIIHNYASHCHIYTSVLFLTLYVIQSFCYSVLCSILVF